MNAVESDGWRGIAFGNSKFVAVADSGSTNRVMVKCLFFIEACASSGFLAFSRAKSCVISEAPKTFFLLPASSRLFVTLF